MIFIKATLTRCSLAAACLIYLHLGYSASLDDLTDVTISAPSTGQTLHRTSAGHWTNQNNWLNVLDFGADPTGKLDSSDAIQAALDEARSESNVGTGTGTIVGYDGYPGLTQPTREPLRQGGVVYFPQGEYTISKTLRVYDTRLVGSLGTEIQAIVPGSGQATAYTVTAGEDGSAEVFQLHGRSAIEHLFLDLALMTGTYPNNQDYDPTDSTGMPNVTWFVAKAHDTIGNNVHMSNVETTQYSQGARVFFRNDTPETTLHATNVHFVTWEYGFKYKDNYGDLMLTDVRGVGYNPDGFNPKAFVPNSAFILSNGSNDGTLESCYAAFYESGLKLVGAYPAFHDFRITNTRFEGTRIGIKCDPSTRPSMGIIATNCEFMCQEYGIYAHLSSQTAGWDPYRRLLLSNCSFMFSALPSLSVMNEQHIRCFGCNVPISITNCHFLDRSGGYLPSVRDCLVWIVENNGQPITFSNNTLVDQTSSQAAVHFCNTRSSNVVSGNIVRQSSSSRLSMLLDGVWTGLVVNANQTHGGISVWDNGTPISGCSGKYCISGNVTGY